MILKATKKIEIYPLFRRYIFGKTTGTVNSPPPPSLSLLSVKRLFELIDAPVAKNTDVCATLPNIILKAFDLNNSDREEELGCLRSEKQNNYSCIDILCFSVFFNHYSFKNFAHFLNKLHHPKFFLLCDNS